MNESLKEAVASLKPSTIDRLPPNSLEAEQGVLGCILLDPNTCLGLCIEKLKDDGKAAFYDLRHQTIYETLSAMFTERQKIDLITVQQHLKDRQLLEQIGGIAYLSDLQDKVPSTANLSYYLEITHEKLVLRKMIQTCTEAVGRVYDYEGDVKELMDEVETNLMAINSLRVEGRSLDMDEVVNDAISDIERDFETQGAPSGIPTGFQHVDAMTGGLHPAEMFIIAARPSVGKSSLMMNWAEHQAFNLEIPVGVFSLEMSARSLIRRSIGSLARVNARKPWLCSTQEMERLHVAQATIRKGKRFLHVDDTGGLSLLELRAKARRMVQQYGIKVAYIDYLQLLHGTSKKAQGNRQVEISEISSGLKEMAKELGIAVVVLAQLNRDLEKTKRAPRIADLRESGSLEQDADLIGLLSNELDEDEQPVELAGGSLKIIFDIAKQRNGPTGPCYLEFFKTFTRFFTLSRVSGEDVSTPHND